VRGIGCAAGREHSITLPCTFVVAKKAPAKRGTVAAARSGTKGSSGNALRGAWEFVKSIAGTVALFLVLRTFFIEAYRIPSGSMIPTMLVGDWLFVNKLRFGPNIPFTSINLPGYAEPSRGDVVVFVSPYQADNGDDPTPILVKRLIGMPGDTIYGREGVVYINGQAQRQGFASADQTPGDGTMVAPNFDWQKPLGLKNTRFGSAPAQPSVDTWGPLVVPPRHFWMMGDNRYDSKDSRFWGFVPRENVRGRPLFVYYSYVPQEASDRPVSFLTDIRWSRLGHMIR
jgi:signal peptidase I